MHACWVVKLNFTSTRRLSLIYSRMFFYLVPVFFSASQAGSTIWGEPGPAWGVPSLRAREWTCCPALSRALRDDGSRPAGRQARRKIS